MTFTKGAVAGFVFGTALALVLTDYAVKNHPWVIDLKKQQRLSRKEVLARINDQVGELEILRAFVGITDECSAQDFIQYIPELRIRALTDPVFLNLLIKLESASE